MGPYVPTPKLFTISGDPERVIYQILDMRKFTLLLKAFSWWTWDSNSRPTTHGPAVDPTCGVTGRRHRSPCRSAYLLVLAMTRFDHRRRRREAAIFFPESWWHLTMWGSRLSHFMMIPNTKRRLNNTKTDQLPISEVITGLPRPCHNTIQAHANPHVPNTLLTS